MKFIHLFMCIINQQISIRNEYFVSHEFQAIFQLQFKHFLVSRFGVSNLTPQIHQNLQEVNYRW